MFFYKFPIQDMDIGIIFLEDGNVKKMGDYFSNSYDIPAKDDVQDWKLDRRKTQKSGINVEVYFSRKLDTEDTEKVREIIEFIEKPKKRQSQNFQKILKNFFKIAMIPIPLGPLPRR